MWLGVWCVSFGKLGVKMLCVSWTIQKVRKTFPRWMKKVVFCTKRCPGHNLKKWNKKWQNNICLFLFCSFFSLLAAIFVIFSEYGNGAITIFRHSSGYNITLKIGNDISDRQKVNTIVKIIQKNSKFPKNNFKICYFRSFSIFILRSMKCGNMATTV